MTFESRIIAFAERFLSARTFELIVEPALADFHYDEDSGRRSGIANRLAVLRAVGGALYGECRHEAGGFFALTLLPTSYYVFMLAICLDLFQTWGEFFGVVMLILLLSLGPVMVCFWPRRHSPSLAD